MKSLCIKTNNSNLIKYLLDELNNIELDNICFSCRQFKYYKNVIIHYSGNGIEDFLNKISYILSLLIIDNFEETILQRIILQNYFYFNVEERHHILEFCFDSMAYDFSSTFDKKFKIIYEIFYSYISKNKTLYIEGFANFRLKPYIEFLDNIVNDAVNNYLIEKEYLEFISLLRLYINTQKNNCNIVHVIYSNSESILLDENKEIIQISSENFKAKYLSDISFSSNDYTLNSLLTLLPKKIYIHLIDSCADEFINTLQSIFENRASICTDCNICNLYRSQPHKTKSPHTSL